MSSQCFASRICAIRADIAASIPVGRPAKHFQPANRAGTGSTGTNARSPKCYLRCVLLPPSGRGHGQRRRLGLIAPVRIERLESVADGIAPGIQIATILRLNHLHVLRLCSQRRIMKSLHLGNEEISMTIASDLLRQHIQTLVDDNAQWQTLIADDILWELAYAPSLGHPAKLSGRAEAVRHATWFVGAVVPQPRGVCLSRSARRSRRGQGGGSH